MPSKESARSGVGNEGDQDQDQELFLDIFPSFALRQTISLPPLDPNPRSHNRYHKQNHPKKSLEARKSPAIHPEVAEKDDDQNVHQLGRAHQVEVALAIPRIVPISADPSLLDFSQSFGVQLFHQYPLTSVLVFL